VAFVVFGFLTLMLTSGSLPASALESRLSGAVAFAPETPKTRAFLKNPSVGYVRAYLRFGPDLADDVIMFVDQEMLEGVAKPRWIKGGDWMGFVGVQRAGGVWIAGGTEATEKGKPSSERKWVIRDLKHRLKPGVWYRLTVIADFAKRRFVSFNIKGSGLDRTIDLSKVRLDYPNYMPFDRAGMIYIVGAMRGRSMMREEGTPIVYFDDVEGGVVDANGKLKRLFFNGFESQTTVGKQPLSGPPIQLDKYRFNHWYKERDKSLVYIEKAPFARSGKSVGVADVNLQD
jgi:hypothetical protein